MHCTKTRLLDIINESIYSITVECITEKYFASCLVSRIPPLVQHCVAEHLIVTKTRHKAVALKTFKCHTVSLPASDPQLPLEGGQELLLAVVIGRHEPWRLGGEAGQGRPANINICNIITATEEVRQQRTLRLLDT